MTEQITILEKEIEREIEEVSGLPEAIEETQNKSEPQENPKIHQGLEEKPHSKPVDILEPEQELPYSPIPSQSAEESQERLISVESIASVFGTVFGVLTPFVTPIAEKVGSYPLYCLLLLAVYLVCFGLVYLVFKLLSYKNQIDFKKSRLGILKIIVISCIIIIAISALTYFCAYPPAEAPVATEATEPDELKINPNRTLAAGNFHSVILWDNGTVSAVGRTTKGRCDVAQWEKIVAISAASHTVGLKSDGTVLAIGENDDNQCFVSDWDDIVDIDTGDKNTILLHGDGTVSVIGDNEHGQTEVSSWTNIIQVEVGLDASYGLTKDGTIVVAGSDNYEYQVISKWSDIKAISASSNHVVALKNDGTVVAVGNDDDGQCQVSDWKDITAISAGSLHTVGLKRDGTVVATGNNGFHQLNVSDWENVEAISAGMYHTIGRTKDGKSLAVGCDGEGRTNLPDAPNT